KLLLADDSVTIQRIIELTFSGEDIDVVAVSDGEQAIARIPIDRPDIILADIGMPTRSRPRRDATACWSSRSSLSTSLPGSRNCSTARRARRCEPTLRWPGRS